MVTTSGSPPSSGPGVTEVWGCGTPPDGRSVGVTGGVDVGGVLADAAIPIATVPATLATARPAVTTAVRRMPCSRVAIGLLVGLVARSVFPGWT
jgi:hypothetical protein